MYVARPFQVKVLSVSLASPVPIVMSTGSGVPTGAFCPALITNKLTGVGNFPVHLQETFSDVVKTDKTGLSKTAHTRWMISAFANFLPGSTIFRLA